jgi:23S rRNA (pseudouridine1915-N3)-methyltransferase
VRVQLIAAGTRRPAWEREGYQTYARRLPRECALTLLEIPVARRAPGAALARLVEHEGELMLRAVAKGARVVALDVRGEACDTRTLATRLATWMRDGRDVALLIGGPDGLAPACLQAADARWSLSPLTLPHGLARIVVAEQLYRAWSVLTGHPYHRD